MPNCFEATRCTVVLPPSGRWSSGLLGVLAIVAGSAIAPAAVHADARADIVELRHDRSPTRHQLLGWTARGEAAFRWIRCSEGGERHCSAAVGAFGVGTEREREAIAALGPLTPPTGIELGRGAFGDVLGASSDIRARLIAVPGEEPLAFVRLAVHAGSARVELGRMGSAQTIDGFGVVAYPSPDGSRLAIAARVESTVMCWDFTDVSFQVLDVAEVRRRLGAAH